MKKKIAVMLLATVICLGFVKTEDTHAENRIPKITGIQTTSFYALAE